MKPVVYILAACCSLAALSGCWPPFRRDPVPAAPVAFPVPPDTRQMVMAVNANSANVRQLQAEVKVSMQGAPPLTGNLAIERPRRIHLRAGLFGLSSLGIDLGSNDEAFWFWLKQSVSRDQPAAVYYARHDEFAKSQLRHLIPVEPEWLIEALGVIQLNPDGPHEGPFEAGKDRLVLHSRIATAEGIMTRTTVLHSKFGWVLEQHIYDTSGKRIVSTFASEHQHYKEFGVTLPHHVEMRVAPRPGPDAAPSPEMTLKIDISHYEINRLLGDPEQLWALPRPKDYPLINLADPRNEPPRREARMPARSPPRNAWNRPQYRPVYRGLPAHR